MLAPALGETVKRHSGRNAMTLEIKTASELVDPELEARWARRRTAHETDVLQRILRAFVERPGPVVVEEIVKAFPDRPVDGIREALTRLDEEDLIQVREGLVDMAYPFSALPTHFVVQLADRGDRYTCCAIDALGVAPMLGQPVHIRSRCHHCDEPLEMSVDPSGPAPEAYGAMVWVGRQCGDERRISASL
jgi:Alkylmercury lyase